MAAEERDNQLTDSQKFTISKYVSELLQKWFALLGVVNLVVLLGGLAYIFFILPNRAVTEVMAGLGSDFKTLTIEVGAAQKTLKDTQKNLEDSQKTIAEMESKVAEYRRRFESLEKNILSLDTQGAIQQAAAFIDFLKNSDAQTLLSQMSELKPSILRIENQFSDEIVSLRSSIEAMKGKTSIRFGVQFSGTVPANSTHTWFVHSVPETQRYLWHVVPTGPTQDIGEPQIEYKVQIERQAPNLLKYYIVITNLTGKNVDVECRYVLLNEG